MEREEDDCAGRLDCADKQSAGQAFGFAFSKSSQILSPHRPIFSIGGCCSNGAGGAVFLKIKKAPIPPTIKIIKINIVNFFIISVYQKNFSYPTHLFTELFFKNCLNIKTGVRVIHSPLFIFYFKTIVLLFH